MNYLKDRTIRPGTMAPGLGEARENAKKMKAMGIDLEMIRQITGITL